MALDVSQLSLTQDDLKEFSGAIFEAVFQNPALNTTNQVYAGIKAKTQIVLLGLSTMSGQKLIDCTIGSSPTIPSSEKWWDPEEIGDRYTQCYKDLEKSFVVWGMNCGVRKADLSDTDFARFMIERVGQSSSEALLRHVWFGDKAAANISGGGDITNGVDVAYFNAIDGFFLQLFGIGAANPTQQIPIAKNAGASYAAQAFDDTDTDNKVAETTFASMKYNSDYRLRDQEDLIFLCTQSMADQYAKELRSRNIDASYTRIEGGYDVLKFENISLIPMNVWDRNIRANFDDGTKYLDPHRVVLSTKQNLGIGVCSDGSLTSMDSFYDKKDRTFNTDYAYDIDAKVLEDYMIMLGA